MWRTTLSCILRTPLHSSLITPSCYVIPKWIHNFYQRNARGSISLPLFQLSFMIKLNIPVNYWWTLFKHNHRQVHRPSQWPRGLRHELSTPAKTLGSWVRIPLEAWLFVCIYSVFVLSCVQVAALRRADPPSKESYWLCIRLSNWKSGQGPTKGCRAI
jgi:hypothetical protein